MSSRRTQSGGSSQRRLSGPGNPTLGRNQRDQANARADVHRRADNEDIPLERDDSDNNESESTPPPGRQNERIVGEKRGVERSASRDPGGRKRSLSQAISEYVRHRNPKKSRVEPEYGLSSSMLRIIELLSVTVRKMKWRRFVTRHGLSLGPLGHSLTSQGHTLTV
jgi:hypothetical protein